MNSPIARPVVTEKQDIPKALEELAHAVELVDRGTLELLNRLRPVLGPSKSAEAVDGDAHKDHDDTRVLARIQEATHELANINYRIQAIQDRLDL